MKARSYWVTAAHHGELREQELAAPADGEALVRSLVSGVSRGTERLVHRGGVPESQAARMRAPFQAGDFPWPVKYGYVSVGVVEAGALPVGTRVFCLHPHQDRYVVPAGWCTPLPDAVPTERATLTANLETALNAVWDAGVLPGDRVGVVGAGVVGCLVAWLCGRIPATHTTLVDLLPERAPIAAALGVDFATSPPPELDLAVHTSASAGGLAAALGAVGDEGTVLEVSWYGDGAVPSPLGGAFHSRRLTLRSSQVSQLPPHRRPRWDHARRLQTVMELLQDPALDVLLDHTLPFSSLPLQLPELLERPGLCTVVRYA